MKKNRIIVLIMIFMLLLMNNQFTKANQVTGTLSCSPTTITVGQTENVVVSFSAPSASVFDFTLGYISGTGSATSKYFYDGTGGVSSGSVTLSVTGSSAGTVTLGVTSGLVALIDSDVDTSVVFNNCNVTVVEASPTPGPDPTPVTPDPETPTLSNNYYLNSLSVSPGSLSPAFSTANDVYFVSLEEGTTTYSISASVADPSAVILSGVGSFTVPSQEFLHRVVIQAENGLMWEYHINFSLPDDRSDNNNLESLSVSNGRLTPAFDADVLNYTVEVARGVTSVSIIATTQDDTATVTGTGEVKLNEEEDTIVDVVVTAENNQAKIYKITFRVATIPEQSITTGGVTYTFDYDIPEGIEKIGFTPQTDLTGFEEGTPYFENKSKTLKAIYLNDGEESNWYLLKEDNQVGQKLVLIEINDKLYGYIGLDNEVLEQLQMKSAKIKLGEIEIDGWSFNDNTLEDYLMLYVIDESGDPDYYLYQLSEEVMLKIGDFRLLDPSLIEVEPQEEIEEVTPSKRNLDVQSILFLIISLLAIVGLVIVVYFIRRNRKSTY